MYPIIQYKKCIMYIFIKHLAFVSSEMKHQKTLKLSQIKGEYVAQKRKKFLIFRQSGIRKSILKMFLFFVAQLFIRYTKCFTFNGWTRFFQTIPLLNFVHCSHISSKSKERKKSLLLKYSIFGTKNFFVVVLKVNWLKKIPYKLH